ncbi:hypothetical protein DFJ73DRAFT_812077 [Zopfochytrium polystomum]|nr:hypothetical protein DFJ73DRAFT_812077 [Zopfochytrium polystomum]
MSLANGGLAGMKSNALALESSTNARNMAEERESQEMRLDSPVHSQDPGSAPYPQMEAEAVQQLIASIDGEFPQLPPTDCTKWTLFATPLLRLFVQSTMSTVHQGFLDYRRLHQCVDALEFLEFARRLQVSHLARRSKLTVATASAKIGRKFESMWVALKRMVSLCQMVHCLLLKSMVSVELFAIELSKTPTDTARRRAVFNFLFSATKRCFKIDLHTINIAHLRIAFLPLLAEPAESGGTERLRAFVGKIPCGLVADEVGCLPQALQNVAKFRQEGPGICYSALPF